jgi:NMT1-like family
MNIGNHVQKFWRYLSVAATVAILLGAGVFVFESLPPRTIVMATGAEGGANYELGIRYREILAREGVELQLQPTTGSLENLRRLRDSKSGVSAGFTQGGTTTKKESPELESLGTIFYEPLWLFRRAEIGEGAQGLRGRRLSIGSEGSGGRALALQIISRTKLDSIIGELSGFAPQVAAEKLIAGEIDAAFIVTGWESPVIQSLLNAKGIEADSYLHADALIAIYPFLHKLSCLPGSSICRPTARQRMSCCWRRRPVLPCARTCIQPCSTFCSMQPSRFIHSLEFSRRQDNSLLPNQSIFR